MAPKKENDRTPHPTGPVKRVIREVNEPGMVPVHPALIPGIGVERTQPNFATNWTVFAVAGAAVIGIILWALISPENMLGVGQSALSWVTSNFGWLFSVLAVVVLGFMLVLGYGRTGGVRLGADQEKPEFSTISWIAMLFSAGMGIGLLFYGPLEPLTFFLEPPHGNEGKAGTVDAMHDALSQTMFHWGPIAWGFYGLVGGAIAYSAYRRGRAPLISAIFEPMFKRGTSRLFNGVVDIFAIIVTLFGTAVSLGLGVLQIGRGIEIVSGAESLGTGLLLGVLAVLTGAFVLSAVSGVKRGIRALSNINLALAGGLALFIFVVGPTLVLVTLIPAGFLDFFSDFFTMAARNSLQGEDVSDFMDTWTTYYWAWWISWSPFVGLFIAKISRGRTLREFVTVVILIPSSVCFLWFGIVGGTAMWQEFNGAGLSDSPSNEDYLFGVLNNLPLGPITSVLAMLSIVIYFVTSADSASIVMGSMSQRGRPEPSSWATVTWGLLLGAVGATLLLVGGRDALNGLQSIMIVAALPFALVVIGIMISWARDLRSDPYVLRLKYAKAAIAQGVRRGIAEHGDDFVFDAAQVAEGEGAGAGVDTSDPALSEWYTKAATGATDLVTADDVQRSLEPGRIQPRGPVDPSHTASGEASLTVGEERWERRRDEEPEQEK